jgi:hypothetical protein
VALSDYQIALDLLARPAAAHFAEARRRLDASAAILHRLDSSHPVLEDCLLLRGRLAFEAGELPRALVDLGEAAARLRERRGEDHPSTREADDLLSQARTAAAITAASELAKGALAEPKGNGRK